MSYERIVGMLNAQIEDDIDHFVKAAKATRIKFEGTHHKTWGALVEAVWSFDPTLENLKSLKENHGSKAVDLVMDLQRVTGLLAHLGFSHKDIKAVVASGAKLIAAGQANQGDYPITRERLIGVLRYWRVSPEAVALEEQRKKTLGS